MTYCSAICFCKQCFIKTQTFCLIYVLLMDAFMIHQRSCAFEMEVVCLTKAKLFTFTEKDCDHSFWKYYTGVVQFSCSVVSDALQTHGLQHARPPCPSPTPRVYPNSCPLSQWCHPTISSSAVPFSSYLQSFPTSESFQMSQFFASGGQSIGVSASASVLPMNNQDWSPLGWTGLVSLQSKGLTRVFSNTTVQKLLFFSAQLSL